MSYFKRLTIAISISLLLFINPFCCIADDLVWNEGEKEAIFEKAKQQDRYVLLLAGRHTCGYCQRAFGWFNSSLRKIVDDNYFTWFVNYDSERYKTISQYTAEFDTGPITGIYIGFPIICLINPADPDKDFTVFWAPDSRNELTMRQRITPPSLLSFQDLNWVEDRNEVLNLAKEQGKYIFKFVGIATSPNSKNVIKQLNESALREVLEGNYILWYSSDVSEANLDAKVLEGEEEIIKTLPYISIIYHEEPDKVLEEAWGALNEESLENILKQYTVSNEKIGQHHTVFVSGDVLHISNQMGNEQIRVYSMTGQSIATVQKNDFTVRIDASDFPKGILVVHSSAGWNTKIIKQ